MNWCKIIVLLLKGYSLIVSLLKLIYLSVLRSKTNLFMLIMLKQKVIFRSQIVSHKKVVHQNQSQKNVNTRKQKWLEHKIVMQKRTSKQKQKKAHAKKRWVTVQQQLWVPFFD